MNTKNSTKSKPAKEAIIVQCVQPYANPYKSYNINIPVDYLLKKAKNYIRENGKSIIVIPDLEILGGYFKISNGTLSDFSSLKRIGDATISNTRSIQAKFGFSTLKLKCDYELIIGSITFNGNIFVAINGYEIATKLNVDYNDYDKTYDVNLEYFKINRGKITVKMTLIDSLMSFMNIITSQFLSLNESQFNTELYDIIEIIIKNFMNLEYFKINHKITVKMIYSLMSFMKIKTSQFPSLNESQFNTELYDIIKITIKNFMNLEYFKINCGKMTGLIDSLMSFMNIITSQFPSLNESQFNTELYDIIEITIKNFIKEQIRFHL